MWKLSTPKLPQTANALPVPVISCHTAEQLSSATNEFRGAIHYAFVFYGDSGLERGYCRTKAIPDSVRLALPRPPNLESQY